MILKKSQFGEKVSDGNHAEHSKRRIAAVTQQKPEQLTASVADHLVRVDSSESLGGTGCLPFQMVPFTDDSPRPLRSWQHDAALP